MENKEYVINPDDVELERLKEQGGLVTASWRWLSESIDLKRGRVLDIASGAGDWGLLVAKLNPGLEVIGFDINQKAVDYSNEQAFAQQIRNAEFCVKDLFKPLDLESESCDVVNMRFVVGVLPGEYWLPLLAECYRILKPGGMIRLIESEFSSVSGAPHYHTLQKASFYAFWSLGKSFAPTEIGLGPMLPKFLKRASFLNVSLNAFMIDYSAGADAHELMTEDFILAAQSMQKKQLFTKYGGLTQEEYDVAFEGMCHEMRDDPEWAALWYLSSFQAYKPV